MADVQIYALCDPVTDVVRYVGKAGSAADRYKRHLREARLHNRPVHCWIRKLQREGQAPTLRILAVCLSSDWESAERQAIADARTSGAALLNVAIGGVDIPVSDETRRANGPRAVRARERTPQQRRLWELRRNLAQSIKANGASDSLKAKMRARPDVFGGLLSLLQN